MDISTRQKNSKETQALNDTLNQEDFIDIYRALHPSSVQFSRWVVSNYLWPSVICLSEVIDISPSNLDSSLCFIQPSISHDVLCI